MAFEETLFPEGAFEFVRKLNEYEPVMVTGLFIPQVRYSDVWSYGGAMVGAGIQSVVLDDPGLIRKTIQRFETVCQHNGIPYRVHSGDNDFSLQALVKETRYADVMVISSEKFFHFLSVPDPGNYMKDVMKQAECPVVIVPEHHAFPEKLILAYDGHASSVYAIKQFANIFPNLASLPTLLVYANEQSGTDIPEEIYVEELVTQHYPNLDIMKLHMDNRKQFARWVDIHPKALLVSGAFGRSAMSSIIRKSYITDIIAEQRMPIFIAHR